MNSISVKPLEADSWVDLADLFGDRGGTEGCWCMYWRVHHVDFMEYKGEANRERLHSLVTKGESPGLVAYLNGQAVGWCAIGRREDFPRLEKSRTLKRLDNRQVWSVPCFYIDRRHRRAGIAAQLLRGAIRWVRDQGGEILEGYPVRTGDPSSNADAYTGYMEMFTREGFVSEADNEAHRTVMRRLISQTQ